MKNLFSISLMVISVLINSCTNGQTQDSKTVLSANEFFKNINEESTAPILDVRTPGEFSKGHLQNARNIDWNGTDFDKQIGKFDKSTPVFVYCLSGARSSAAARHMRSEGFKYVYELSGGIIKWRAANLPETSGNTTTTGMTKQQFDALLNSDKLVLIDFYADWCAPCKEMKPWLDEISKDMADKVVVIRINTDENQALCKGLKIDALPVLQLYKNKYLKWTNTGTIGKAEVVKQLQ